MHYQCFFGVNCTEVLEPRSPYALKTISSQCVVGPIEITSERDAVVNCNRVAVQDAGTKILKHHFEI